MVHTTEEIERAIREYGEFMLDSERRPGLSPANKAKPIMRLIPHLILCSQCEYGLPSPNKFELGCRLTGKWMKLDDFCSKAEPRMIKRGRR